MYRFIIVLWILNNCLGICSIGSNERDYWRGWEDAHWLSPHCAEPESYYAEWKPESSEQLDMQPQCCDDSGSLLVCLDISHRLGKGVGYCEGYSSLGAFIVPTCYSCFQPFLDLRGHVFNKGRWAANVGIGGRYISSCCNLAYGGNIYYDYRKGCHRGFHQLGLGAELLGSCWDLRVNGYIPIGRREWKSHTARFDDFEGDFFATCQQRIKSIGGVDGELGFFLKCKDPCCLFDFDLYAAVGPYFFASRCDRDIFGGQVRLAARFCDYLEFEVRATSDRVCHGRVQGRFSIYIPFDFDICCRKNSCAQPCRNDFACRRVERREIIFLKEECCWDWNWDDKAGRKKDKG